MTESGRNRRKRSEVIVDDRGREVSVIGGTFPLELDLQAWMCFSEPRSKFPKPVSDNPLEYGKGGYMHHVDCYSGSVMLLPLAGRLIDVEGEGKMMRRRFVMNDSIQANRNVHFKHQIICWQIIVENSIVGRSMVICFDYPQLSRVNLPVVSEPQRALPKVVAKACYPSQISQVCQAESSSFRPLKLASGRTNQFCEEVPQVRNQSEDIADHMA